MFISAGRSAKSKYDSRVPIHIAIAYEPGDTPLSICGQRAVAPVTGAQVAVTCSRCLSLVHTLPDMCRIPTQSSAEADAELQIAG